MKINKIERDTLVEDKKTDTGTVLEPVDVSRKTNWPEDVEEQAAKIRAEVQKRLKDARKVALETKGKDFVESLKGRSELAELVKNLKENGIAYKISRSKTEGMRYDVSYLKEDVEEGSNEPEIYVGKRTDAIEGDVRPNEEQIERGEENGWTGFELAHGYGVFQDDENSPLYIARIDDMEVFDGDAEAMEQAIKDGFSRFELSDVQRDYIMKETHALPETIIDCAENHEILDKIVECVKEGKCDEDKCECEDEELLEEIHDGEYEEPVSGWWINGTLKDFDPQHLVDRVIELKRSLHSNRIAVDNDDEKVIYHITVSVMGGTLDDCNVFVDVVKDVYKRPYGDADDINTYHFDNEQERIFSRDIGDKEDKWQKAVEALNEWKAKELRLYEGKEKNESCSDKELADRLVANGSCEDEKEAKKRVSRMSKETKDELCKSTERQNKQNLVNDSLKESRWKKTISNHGLHDAISDADYEGIRKAAIAILKDVEEYLGDDSDTYDLIDGFENLEDYDEDECDYLLGELYDLCDNVDVFINLDRDESLKEDKIDIKYVVSLFGDDNHFYVAEEDEDPNNEYPSRIAGFIKDATQFDSKEEIDIWEIIDDCISMNKMYAGEADTASLFGCKTIEEVNEKDLDYFFNNGYIKIIPIYNNQPVKIVSNGKNILESAESLKEYIEPKEPYKVCKDTEYYVAEYSPVEKEMTGSKNARYTIVTKKVGDKEFGIGSGSGLDFASEEDAKKEIDRWCALKEDVKVPYHDGAKGEIVDKKDDVVTIEYETKNGVTRRDQFRKDELEEGKCEESWYRGCEDVEFIWNGTQSDPELEYLGHRFNYWDIEDALWQMFLEETGHEDSESDDPEVEAEFDEFVQEHCKDYLDEVIANEYGAEVDNPDDYEEEPELHLATSDLEAGQWYEDLGDAKKASAKEHSKYPALSTLKQSRHFDELRRELSDEELAGLEAEIKEYADSNDDDAYLAKHNGMYPDGVLWYEGLYQTDEVIDYAHEKFGGNDKVEESLKIISDISEYKPWSGAVSHWDYIQDNNLVDSLEEILEEVYPDGITMTQLNDLLWFDWDSVKEWLGIYEEEE